MTTSARLSQSPITSAQRMSSSGWPARVRHRLGPHALQRRHRRTAGRARRSRAWRPRRRHRSSPPGTPGRGERRHEGGLHGHEVVGVGLPEQPGHPVDLGVRGRVGGARRRPGRPRSPPGSTRRAVAAAVGRPGRRPARGRGISAAASSSRSASRPSTPRSAPSGRPIVVPQRRVALLLQGHGGGQRGERLVVPGEHERAAPRRGGARGRPARRPSRSGGGSARSR